ncbi:MAG: type II secretion system F family protein [Succinivibrionaceae bacterium]|nr:type II secretion system F family protein [Succinivibrionaceae bacterium]
MAKFKYKAKSSGGDYVTGVVEAGSLNEAMADLYQQNLIPIDLKQTADREVVKIKWPFRKRLGLQELVMFCRQMYSLTKAGVPIIKAIAGLAESTDQESLRDSLRKLSKDLAGGKSLTLSMQEQSDIYSSLFISMVNVGENTGRLEDVFKQLADYYSMEYETRKRISAAMRYPTLVILFIAAAMVVLNIFVIPVFSQMFAKFGVDLPLTTRILIGTSNFFVQYWPIMAGVAVALPILIRWSLNKKSVRLAWDRVKLRLPVMGSIIDRSLLGRFSRSFSLMLQSGVPLNLALSLVAEAIDNKFLEERILDMRRQIEQGNSLSTVATQSKMFTPLVLQMFSVGDETGRVDELLQEAADYYEREVDYDLKSLTAKIEPILLIFVAVIVAILALGIFTPMWDMYGAMQGK